MSFKDGCPSCFSMVPEQRFLIGLFKHRVCDDVWHEMWTPPTLDHLQNVHYYTDGIPNWNFDLKGIPVSEEKRTPIIVVGDLERHEEKEREKMLKMIRGEENG